jgi:drug/metabolite transporter (DMT)-like permease
MAKRAAAARAGSASMSAAARAPAPPGGGQAAGVALVLLAALLWSSSGLFVKLLTVNAPTLIGIRSAVAVLALLPFVRYRLLRVDGTLLLLAAAFGATEVSFVLATRWTTAANAIALHATAPAWVFAGSWLAARRIQAPLLLPLGLIGAGIAAMLAEPAHGTSLQGNLVGLAGGLSFAVTQLCFKHVNQPVVGTVMLANLGSALGVALLAPGALQLEAVAAWEWVSLGYLGAIQIGLAFLCFTAGVRRITASQGAVLSLLEPLLNPLWVFLALGEAPSAYGFAGYALILGGIVADFWLRLYLPSLQPARGAA